MKTIVSFNSSQFDSIFPFFILMNKQMVVESMGKTIEKLFPGIVGKSFRENFILKRPELSVLSFESLQSVINQMVIIECLNPRKTTLRGQLELLHAGNQLLFIGSPWFASIEQVVENKLRLDDFAYHDPMIDLLHVLKTQEITTDELKKFLQTINKQKNDLKDAAKEIHDIALFPMQNPDPLIRIDLNGNVLTLNPTAEKFSSFLYKNKNYTTTEFWQEIASQINPDKEREIIEAKSDDKWYSFVIKHLVTDGYYNIYGRDVTDTKEKEDQLLILSSIAAQNTNGVVIADKEGKIEWVNNSYEQMTGYSIDEVKGKKPGSFLQGKDTNPETVAYLKTQILNGEPYVCEILNYHKSGRPYWLRIQGQALKNKNGQIIKYFAIEEDITNQKNAELALKIKEEKYRNIIANINLGLLEVDQNDIIQYANQRFCTMSGYNLDELLGKWAAELFVPEDNREIIESKNELRKQHISDAYELPVIIKSGEFRWWLISGAPNYNDRGESIGSIGIHLDITDQKKLEHALLEAKNEAETSSRFKELFLANMSHEIRTPLNGIIGMIREISREPLSPKQNMYIKNAGTASQHLLSIVNDILDISKIESGQMILEMHPFSLRDVINETISILFPAIEEKSLGLLTLISPQIAPAYIGDSNRIRQILINVISNAIKYTEKGRITIDCVVNRVNSDIHHLQLKISDTGIGMDAAFVKNIFDKFTQSDISNARKYGGTGLGMAITYELIQMMDGSIAVSSEKGIGTSIEIGLNLAQTLESEIQIEILPESFNSLKNKNILLVEDNELNRMVAQELLSFHNIIVTEAINGIQAIEKLKTSSFDLILMDLQMPGMGGLEATKIIRKEMALEIPIIALTGNAFKAELEHCKLAGMNGYITKPYEEKVLLGAILKGLNLTTNTLLQSQYQPASQTKLYNLDYLSQFSRGNTKLIENMIGVFIEQTPPAVEQIKEAWKNGDLETVKSVAHRIKSNIDMFGIEDLKQDIRTIEASTLENLTTPEFGQLIKKFEEIITRVVKEIPNEIH